MVVFHRRVLATAGVVACLTPACFLRPNNTYTYPKGDIPLVVTNQYSFPVCSVDILPPQDRKHELPWDPLKFKNPPAEESGDTVHPEEPVEPLPPGKTLQIGVKPGTYTIEAESCDQLKTGSVVVSINGPATVVLAEGQSFGALGSGPVRLSLAVHSAGCIADNDWSPASNMYCCSGDRTHWSNTEGRLVCGP
jgi:hypothetical protein|nr:hypothetical protein [Kofleriaceae bacterium]